MQTKPVLLIVVDSHKPEFVEAARAIASDRHNMGVKVDFLDVSSIAFPQWGKRSFQSVKDFLTSDFDDSQFVAWIPSKSAGTKFEFEQDLLDWVHNYALDRMKGDSRGRTMLRKLVERRLRSHVAAVSELESFLRQYPATYSLALRNGRSPWQYVLRRRLASDIEIEYYDYPFFLGKTLAFVGRYPVHDRVSYQRKFSSAPTTLSAREWYQSRRPVGALEVPASAVHLAIFSSSTFEFVSMPDIWNTSPFSDQYEGFAWALSKLSKEQVGRSVLRIHPNLGSAAWRVQIQDVLRIREICKMFPSLEVVPHTDRRSSYKILESAENVLVSISTIGLEALSIRKPTWVVGTAFFDTICGVGKLPSPGWPHDLPTNYEGADKLLSGFRSSSIPTELKFPDPRSASQRIRDAVWTLDWDQLLSLVLDLSNKASGAAGRSASRILYGFVLGTGRLKKNRIRENNDN